MTSEVFQDAVCRYKRLQHWPLADVVAGEHGESLEVAEQLGSGRPVDRSEPAQPR